MISFRYLLKTFLVLFAVLNSVVSVAKTKPDWVYRRSPRIGPLVVKTESGKSLYPGEFNCHKNALTLEDFKRELKVYFPSAKSETLYTLAIYEDKLLIKAVNGIQGQQLYSGTITGKEIAKMADLDEPKTPEKVYVSIIEEDPKNPIGNNIIKQDEWTGPTELWKDHIIGTAGKTCFLLIPKDYQPAKKAALEQTLLKDHAAAHNEREKKLLLQLAQQGYLSHDPNYNQDSKTGFSQPVVLQSYKLDPYQDKTTGSGSTGYYGNNRYPASGGYSFNRYPSSGGYSSGGY